MPIHYLLMDTFLLRKNMLNITTSWDDGDIFDVRLSEMLSRHGIKGTFYITKHYRPERVSDTDIRTIAKHHEIGAHTLTHPDLRERSLTEKKDEIQGSKQWLEEILGSRVKMFCYPKGLYDDETVSAVKDAGFLGSRTTRLGLIDSPSDPFRLDTTIQVYPFPFRKLNARNYYVGKLLQPYVQRTSALRALGVSTLSMRSWLAMAKSTFDIAKQHGDVFHLWGHSWEIEKYNMWDDLENLLTYMNACKECRFVTNSELLP